MICVGNITFGHLNREHSSLKMAVSEWADSTVVLLASSGYAVYIVFMKNLVKGFATANASECSCF